MKVALPNGVPWTRPDPEVLGEDEPGHWFSGRFAQQEKAPRRFESLQNALAAALRLSPEDPLVTQAMAELALGLTIRIAGTQYTRISDVSVAITEPGGETQFLNLDSGKVR